MKWNIDDVPIYIAVVEYDGISAAARFLDISKSTVSKAISRLEDALGVRLLERNSRNVRVTSEGEIFYKHGMLIMEQVNETNAVMSGLTATPRGRLVVALPIAFSREIVAPYLNDFQKRYPQVDLEILVTNKPVDIIRDQIDLAVVVGELQDSELVTKKLYRGELMWVSSPDYVRDNKLGESVKDLHSHIKITEKRYGYSRFPVTIGQQKTYIDLSSMVTHVNDPIAVAKAVIYGCGVSFLPDQYCKKYFESGELVPVFDHIDISSTAVGLSAIYPSRRFISNKTRAFLDFLVSISARMG